MKYKQPPQEHHDKHRASLCRYVDGLSAGLNEKIDAWGPLVPTLVSAVLSERTFRHDGFPEVMSTLG